MPKTIYPHPPGFVTRNKKATLITDSLTVDELQGDKVCARYFARYFEQYELRRQEAFDTAHRLKKPIPEYSLPWTKYPIGDPPEIQVPVEAVLGEIYYPMEEGSGRPSETPGCYVGCQDIRKAIEWVLAAKITKAIQVRLSVYFAFPCKPGMLARLTHRQSWRESDTEEESEHAIQFLNKLGPKFAMTALVPKLYDLMVKGEPSQIVGCECYEATAIERLEAHVKLRSKRVRPAEKKSSAKEALRKRTKTREAWQKSRPSTKAVTDTGASSSTESDDFPDVLESLLDEEPVEAVESDMQLNHGAATCYDFDYPAIDIGQAVQEPIVDAVTTPMLQAELFSYYAEVDEWFNFNEMPEPAPSTGKHP